MKPQLKILGIFCLAQLVAIVAGSGYTVTAPNTLRPNTQFHIAVTHHGANDQAEELKLKIEITKADETDPLGGGPTPIPGTVEPKIDPLHTKLSVPSGTTKMESLKIPNWPQGQYILIITGTRGNETIDRRAALSMNSKTSSIFIQTDKSLYQEGQLVQIRSLILNSALRPRANIAVQLSITDPSNNIIKLSNHTTDEYGIIQDELQLSSQPVFGSWYISVTTLASVKDAPNSKIRRRRSDKRPRPGRRTRITPGGESTSVNFVVKEYVLSKFDIKITPPDYIVRGDKDFVLIINATYTFNKGVHGALLLNITDMACTYTWSTCKSKPLVLRINDFTGYLKKTIRMADLDLPKDPYSISIFASVTEKDTGITKNDTASVTIYTTDLTLNINQPSSLRPGIPHVISVILVKQNGRPVISAAGEKVSVSYTLGLGGYTLVEVKLDNKGVANVTVNALPDSTGLTVTAQYKDLKAYGSASVAQSLSTKYLSLTTLTPSPKVGKTIVFEVKSSIVYNGQLSYQVTGRGNILSANTVTAKISPTKGVKISVTASKNMAPHTKFVVFYFTDCGEIVGNAIDVDVDGALETPLTMKSNASKDGVKPGTDVQLTIESANNTNVYLLGVDMSVLLMSTPNDITQQGVLNELTQYDIGNQPYYTWFTPGLIRRPDWGSTGEIFEFCGLTMLTSGLFSKGQSRGPIYFRGFGAMAKTNMMFDEGISTPAAFPQVGAGGGGPTAPLAVRSKFPETWLFEMIQTSSENGIAEVAFTVPDTVTTWHITAFGVNTKTGLGLLNTPNNITVIQPFFISLNLPYSVIRGEILNAQVMIFNYLDIDVTAKVSLSKNSLQEFKSNDGDKTVKISKNDVVTTSFSIEPLIAGKITIQITATTSMAGDSVKQELLVKPEGTTVYRNNATLIKLDDGKPFTSIVTMDFPPNTVPGSGYAEVVGIGDFMTSVYSNIENLISLPSGCGEQNMVSFVPDVAVIKYLKLSGSLTTEIKARLTSYLETGLQTEMNYKRWDNSYSAFGNSDNEGSTWLTAFVVKSFLAAQEFIHIDDSIINPSKDYLANTQTPTGEFEEKGKILYKAMQGGSGKGIAITAFVLIAFLETPGQDNSKYQQKIKLAVDFLEKKLDFIESIYELSIVTYALHLADSSFKDKAFKKLDDQKKSEHGLEYWHYDEPLSTDTNQYNQPQTLDVETTSYALLVYHLRNQSETAFPIFRWLVSRRSSLGGYASSQDTVIGIQALSTVASLFTSKNIDMTVTVTYGTGKSLTYKLNNDNKIVVNTNSIPAKAGSITISATGKGTGLVQVSWNYNIPQTKPKNPAFSVKVTAKRNGNAITIKACTSFLLNDTTNMAIIEIDTLSGNTINRDTLPPYGQSQDLKRIDVSNGETSAAFYFYSIPTTPKEICIQLGTLATSKVDGLKPAAVRVYDYYDPSKSGIAFYNA